VKNGKGIRQERCLTQILFNLYREYRSKEVAAGFVDFKMGVQVIRAAK
jgi:hypothetical protein